MATQLEEPMATDVLEDIFGDGKSAKIINFIPQDDVSTFPFSGTSAAYMIPSNFVRYLYQGDADKKPWITNTPGRPSKDYPWMTSLMGNVQLTPDPKEQVADAENPGWRWAESWRALNTYKALLKKAETTDHPVRDYIASFPTGDHLLNAMFPPDVKALLIKNEEKILEKGFPWVGAPTNTPPGTIYPYPEVRVINGSPAKGFEFKQTGAMGPMSIEASFILSSQLAGINWKVLRAKITPSRLLTGVYWVAGIQPDDKGDRRIIEKRNGMGDRALGYLSRTRNMAGGSADAGFYLALDIDPDVGLYDPRKNVFIFACHVIDPHSRVYVQEEARLCSMSYLAPYRLNESPYSEMAADQKTGVSFYGHGHTAVLKSKAWLDWIGQEILPGHRGEDMPNYKQVGEGHMYILTETEDDVLWPRAKWIEDNMPAVY